MLVLFFFFPAKAFLGLGSFKNFVEFQIVPKCNFLVMNLENYDQDSEAHAKV